MSTEMTNDFVEIDLPGLSDHCVETEIKRLYNRRMGEYFRQKGECEGLLKIIAVLTAALKHLDFSQLRSAHPALSGKTKSRVVLLAKNHFLCFCVDGRKIYETRVSIET